MISSPAVIYVVDDDESIRRALALLLETHGFKVQTFSRAADFFAVKHPKVSSCLVLDMRMPHISGLDLQEAMALQKLTIPIVFISGYGSIPMSVKAMKLGAVDFLPKPFTDIDLLNAIDRAIIRSKTQNKEESETTMIERRIQTLSPRELEVFHFVAQGLQNKQIAQKRGTSLQTIKVHRGRVMKKMQARTVTELISLAQKVGVVSL